MDFTNAVEIPLVAGVPQSLYVALDNTTYNLVLTYRDAINGGWMLDINTALGDPIVCGIAFVCGLNLIGSYSDRALPSGGLFVMSQPIPDAPITFDSLGVSTHLYYVPA